MRKRIYVSIFLMLMFSFIFTVPVFATSTTISIDIYEIKVNCGEYGSFSIDGETYSGVKSFMRKQGDSIVINITPNPKYKTENVSVDSQGDILLGKDSVTVANIESNININIKFKKIKNSNNNTSSNNNSKECDGGKNCVLNHFIDVDTKAWYHHDVDYVVKEGLMKGTGPNTFEPHSSTTRAMIVTMLHRLEKEPITSKPNIFVDVEENLWYSEAVNWATSNEIVFGYGDGKFGPNDPITREQMVAILYRYTKYKNGVISVNDSSKFYDFEDIEEVSTYARAPMKWACSKGIILGDNNQILPQSISERCQIAAILHRFCTNILK